MERKHWTNPSIREGDHFVFGINLLLAVNVENAIVTINIPGIPEWLDDDGGYENSPEENDFLYEDEDGFVGKVELSLAQLEQLVNDPNLLADTVDHQEGHIEFWSEILPGALNIAKCKIQTYANLNFKKW